MQIVHRTLNNLQDPYYLKTYQTKCCNRTYLIMYLDTDGNNKENSNSHMENTYNLSFCPNAEMDYLSNLSLIFTPLQSGRLRLFSAGYKWTFRQHG